MEWFLSSIDDGTGKRIYDGVQIRPSARRRAQEIMKVIDGRIAGE
jgi:hypothetical protein